MQWQENGAELNFSKLQRKKKSSSYFIIGIKAIASGIQTIWRIQKTQILYFAKHSMSMPVTSWFATMKHKNWLLWGTVSGPNQPTSEPKHQTTTANYKIFPVTPSMSGVLGCFWAAAQGQQPALAQMHFGHAAHCAWGIGAGSPQDNFKRR